MRQTIVVAITLAALSAAPHPAQAASTTVQGRNGIDKMVFSNATRAVKTKLFGLGGPCDAHYFRILISWGTKAAYQADGGCYPGNSWVPSLVYLANRDKPENGKIIECPGLRLVYVEGSWRSRVPRSCIPKAANRVRGEAQGSDYGALVEGTAGPTKRLRRG